MNLAPRTLPRCGTSVKVVRPLRWLHSLVTARMPMIGRITVMGAPMAAAKLSKVSWSSGAKMMRAAVARTLMMTMLASSQNPERVSNILRSSTPMRRVRGIGADAVCARGVRTAPPGATASGVTPWSIVVVLMLLLLRAGCLR